MDDQRDSTIPQRPLPKRPPTGLMAWIATVGYISTQYSPDVLLKLHVYPSGDTTHWGASISWAQHKEQVWDKPTLAAALGDLWLEVDRSHAIFATQLDAIRSPVDYADEKWLDVPTQDILSRLIWTTENVFSGDWKLVIVYQPVDNPNARVQARLIARSGSVHVGGRGPSLGDACHDLFRNGARVFVHGANPEE